MSNVDEFVPLYDDADDAHAPYLVCGICRHLVGRDFPHSHVERYHSVALRAGDVVRTGRRGRTWRVRKGICKPAVEGERLTTAR